MVTQAMIAHRPRVGRFTAEVWATVIRSPIVHLRAGTANTSVAMASPKSRVEALPPMSGVRGSDLARTIEMAFSTLRRSEEHTSELQSRVDLVCRLLLEKKKKIN